MRTVHHSNTNDTAVKTSITFRRFGFQTAFIKLCIRKQKGLNEINNVTGR